MGAGLLRAVSVHRMRLSRAPPAELCQRTPAGSDHHGRHRHRLLDRRREQSCAHQLCL